MLTALRILLCLFAVMPLCGDASRSFAQAQPLDRPAQEVLGAGRAVLPLNGPWKFRTGDDPRWADPKLDDSGWESYLIDTEHVAPEVAEVLQAGEFSGWQAHGHPGYADTPGTASALG